MAVKRRRIGSGAMLVSQLQQIVELRFDNSVDYGFADDAGQEASADAELGQDVMGAGRESIPQVLAWSSVHPVERKTVQMRVDRTQRFGIGIKDRADLMRLSEDAVDQELTCLCAAHIVIVVTTTPVEEAGEGGKFRARKFTVQCGNAIDSHLLTCS